MEKRCYGCMKIKDNSPVCEHCGFDETIPNDAHQLPAGTVLMERYLIGRVLGQGGFGITYLAWDTFLNIPAAVKEYFPSGVVMRESAYSLSVSCGSGEKGNRFQNNRERFLREAKALARFSGIPEIVQVSNYFLANNTAYIVMEFVEGITLKQHVKNNGGRLSPEETFALLRPVLEALDKVHATGLVHRDISPDNIMLLPNSGVKLIDFGAVRDVQNANAEQPLTKSTEAILKQGYAPIEQYQKRGSLGPWTDVHALCATVYYCLTGETPPDVPERMMGDVEFSWEHVPGLSRQQRAVLEKGMELMPKHRIQSIKALNAALFAAKPDPKPEPKPEQKVALKKNTPKDAKKKAPLWKIAAAVLSVLAVVLTVLLVGSISGEEKVLADTWQNNVMANDYDTVFIQGISVRDITSVTFLDTTAKAPENCEDVSAGKNGSVVAWAKENGDGYDLFIAGDGGVNGSMAAAWLFNGWDNLKQVSFNGNFHTESAEDLSGMFWACQALEKVDIQSLDTSSATDMREMFYLCRNLPELDLSGFHTACVTDMSYMFNGCKNLKELDLSNFDTAQITKMGGMFSGCSNLSELELTHFDTANVVEMPHMFNGCSKLVSLDLHSFNTANVTNMQGMFAGCITLKNLDISSFRTEKVENMQDMFAGCTALQNLDLNGFDTSGVEYFENFMDPGQTVNGQPWEDLFVSQESDHGTVLDENGFIINNEEPSDELCVLSYAVSNGQRFSDIGCSVNGTKVTIDYTWENNETITASIIYAWTLEPFSEQEAYNIAENGMKIMEFPQAHGEKETTSSVVWNELSYVDFPYYLFLIHVDENGAFVAYSQIQLGYSAKE